MSSSNHSRAPKCHALPLCFLLSASRAGLVHAAKEEEEGTVARWVRDFTPFSFLHIVGYQHVGACAGKSEDYPSLSEGLPQVRGRRLANSQHPHLGVDDGDGGHVDDFLDFGPARQDVHGLGHAHEDRA